MPRNDYSSSSLASILTDIQNGSCSHSKCLDRLIELHFKDSERFKRDFAGHLNRILFDAGDKRDINIEKLVNLIIDFASGKTGTEEDSHYKRIQFSLFSIQHLLGKTNVKDKSIRFRATQILTGILQCLSSDIELDATLKEVITDKMLERSRDKLPSIRCFAIACLSCFQMNHSVMEEFSRIMDSDTNKHVRKAALVNIRISKHTLPSILRRTRDVKEDIRELAFEILTKNDKLTPRHRCELINELLREKTPSQKETTILKNWLALRFGNDIIQLCKMLDIENNEEAAEKALQKTLSVTNLASPIALTTSNISPLSCFYWRVFCEHLKAHKLDSDLDDSLPSLVEYCDILRGVASKSNTFLLKQLLRGCMLFDTADEAGRAKLTSQLASMLTSAPLDVVQLVTKSLFIVETDIEECIRLMVECISELMDPLEEDNEIKKLKDKLTSLQIKAKGSESKEAIKIEESLMEHDRCTWARCCAITEQLLENINKGLNNPMVAGLFHSVILPSVKHKSPEIRTMGLKLLGLFCLFDKEMAISHVPIFIQAITRDNKDVKITSMKILFDFLLAYDFNNQAIQDSQQASPAGQSIQTLLRGYFNSPDEALRSTCVEGFAKLMLADVVLDNSILSLLIEQYYSPNTTSLPRLRQCLHVFLHTYLRARQPTSPNPRVRLFRKALFSALKTFIYSPSSLELPLVEVSTYLLNLLRLGCGKGGSAEEENKLALKVIKQMKADPNGMASPNLCKILRLLRMENGKQDELDFMLHTTRKIIKDVDDKFVVSSLEKFVEIVQNISPTKLVDQKPSEPASPSPPSSPYFTASPLPDDTNQKAETTTPSTLMPPPDVKTPISRKDRRVTEHSRELGDYIDKQKRAFAEVDGFSLAVEVTPKKPKRNHAPMSASKIPTTPSASSTPVRVAVPNTLPRVRKTEKQVKFEDFSSSVESKKDEKQSKRKRVGLEEHQDSKHQKIASSANQQKVVSPKKPRYVLSFTGFKDGDSLLSDLQEKAQKLNMTCYTKEAFDSTVTHVISPAGRKTVKTMTARLAGLWVVDPKWILDCDKASRILPELKYPPPSNFAIVFDTHRYGTKQQNCLFDNKSFAFSPSFLSSTPRSTLHNCKTFITLARGVIVDECSLADYVMVADETEEYPNNECLTNKQFFALLTA